jgi:hypothetical protein
MKCRAYFNRISAIQKKTFRLVIYKDMLLGAINECKEGRWKRKIML